MNKHSAHANVAPFHLYCHQCDNIDGLNKYKQQTMNNLQFYSCARSQHAHAIRMNWLNIITSSTCITVSPVLQYQLHYSTTSITEPVVLQYHLYYSITCITVSPVLQYQLYYSITYITVAPITVPFILQYYLYYNTSCITVAPITQGCKSRGDISPQY